MLIYSVKHDWMNFSYVSFKSILIILHEIYMIIVTHPTTFSPIVSGFCFFSSGTHCKGVSKQLCVYIISTETCFWRKRVSDLTFAVKFSSLETRFNTHYSKRVSKRLSRVVAFIIDLSVSRVRVARKALSLRSCIAQFYPKHNAFKAFHNNFGFITSIQKCVSGSNAYQIALFPRFRKAFLTP